MIEPLTPVTDLQSRLGRVGSIQAWDPWRSRESVAHAKWWVAKIAALSYGNEEAKNPEALFDRIVRLGHLSCLEFVPVVVEPDNNGHIRHLPEESLRHSMGKMDHGWMWSTDESKGFPASAFLVECPLFVARQWMRHRAFSYLEMSRRYTKGSKVAWSYYQPSAPLQGPEYEELGAYTDPVGDFHAVCETEYQRRLDAGWPNEIARGCMPVETLTRFWVAGFDRDWEHFCDLRTDAHAQPEIQVYANWIREHIRNKAP